MEKIDVKDLSISQKIERIQENTEKDESLSNKEKTDNFLNEKNENELNQNKTQSNFLKEKYKYNKQCLPEELKYHSDEEESIKSASKNNNNNAKFDYNALLRKKISDSENNEISKAKTKTKNDDEKKEKLLKLFLRKKSKEKDNIPLNESVDISSRKIIEEKRSLGIEQIKDININDEKDKSQNLSNVFNILEKIKNKKNQLEISCKKQEAVEKEINKRSKSMSIIKTYNKLNNIPEQITTEQKNNENENKYSININGTNDNLENDNNINNNENKIDEVKINKDKTIEIQNNEIKNDIIKNNEIENNEININEIKTNEIIISINENPELNKEETINFSTKNYNNSYNKEQIQENSNSKPNPEIIITNLNRNEINNIKRHHSRNKYPEDKIENCSNGQKQKSISNNNTLKINYNIKNNQEKLYPEIQSQTPIHNDNEILFKTLNLFPKSTTNKENSIKKNNSQISIYKKSISMKNKLNLISKKGLYIKTSSLENNINLIKGSNKIINEVNNPIFYTKNSESPTSIIYSHKKPVMFFGSSNKKTLGKSMDRKNNIFDSNNNDNTENVRQNRMLYMKKNKNSPSNYNTQKNLVSNFSKFLINSKKSSYNHINNIFMKNQINNNSNDNTTNSNFLTNGANVYSQSNNNRFENSLDFSLNGMAEEKFKHAKYKSNGKLLNDSKNGKATLYKRPVFYNQVSMNFNNNLNMSEINDSNLSINYQNAHKNIVVSKYLEDLLILEEKLIDIISYINEKININNKCFDFYNYYLNSFLCKNIEKVFNGIKDTENLLININYLLMSLIICYDISNNIDIYENNTFPLIIEILNLNYDNLMNLFGHILQKIPKQPPQNIWIKTANNIYKQYCLCNNITNNTKYSINTHKKISENIPSYCRKILPKLKNLLIQYETDSSYQILNLLRELKDISYKKINTFYLENIYKPSITESSVLASVIEKTNLNPNNKLIPPPYLHSINKKQFTLILDLNETLINFKLQAGREGYVRIRPYLFIFLEEVSQFYELILFTTATEAFTESIQEVIEYEKKFFDFVFCREHAIIINGDYVKDITRVGRPLNSTIIIDNMPQNFRLQKENGILIKSFWGEEINDKTLYDLMKILVKIAKDGCDVRVSLKKYHDEIVTKISSNISKNNMA